jgi:two-component system cell cycle response regulator DivK
MPKLLLVEDNEMNRDMLSRRLQRKGYEVVIAVNGIEALEAVKTENPELILMDLSLPEMDGWEATRRLKADETTSSIPLIVLTAHALKSDRDGAFETGCDDFDVKPIDFNRLHGKIESLLGNTHPLSNAG